MLWNKTSFTASRNSHAKDGALRTRGEARVSGEAYCGSSRKSHKAIKTKMPTGPGDKIGDAA
jgi:hypothetical protein